MFREEIADDDERVVCVGPLCALVDRSEVSLDGEPLPLTFGQRAMLLALMETGGRVAAREELYQRAFGRPLPTGSRAVDMHITRIRQSLGSKAAAIVSVGRVGYRLESSAL